VAEFNENVWAPWRMKYITALGEQSEGGGCFLCAYRDRPADDARNYVLWRSKRTLVLLNRYPYTSGHLLIAPVEHKPEPEDFDEATLCELMLRLRDAKRAVRRALRADGFNIGMNLGRCAGAGLPDHMHWHLVPRWDGDTNFMFVSGDVRVIPESLDETYRRIRRAASDLGLP